MPKEYYQVGKIVNTHGIHGEVRVIATSDFPDERFKVGTRLAIELPEGYREVVVAGMRQHKQFYLLQFEGYPNLNDVLVFKGHNLKVEASQRADTLAADEYYYSDIIDLEVVEEATGKSYGKVKEILSPGPNDVWIIQKRGQADLLLPYLKTVVKRIDLPNKKAYVEVPEGLIDDAN